eukprot:2426848-Pleurochrysis_carterae.AAC.7
MSISQARSLTRLAPCQRHPIRQPSSSIQQHHRQGAHASSWFQGSLATSRYVGPKATLGSIVIDDLDSVKLK